MNRKIAGLVILILMTFTIACATNTGVEEIDDATLEAAVRAKIVDDVPNEATEIGVRTDNGTVTLTGKVTRNEERTKIADSARATKGVKRVINNITVGAEN